MRKYIYGTLLLFVLLGPNNILGVWAQGTTVLNRQIRISAGTPYFLLFPPDDGNVDEVLTTDGDGILTWEVGAGGAAEVPDNIIGFVRVAACPSGWSEYTPLRGRYAVGLVSGGTNLLQPGTALTDQENRIVGIHNHTIDAHTHVQDAHTHTQDAHNHTQNAHGHTLSGTGNTSNSESGGGTVVLDDAGTLTLSSTTPTNNPATATNQSTTATNQATTGTNAVAGSVVGTNAPYIQLLACKKD